MAKAARDYDVQLSLHRIEYYYKHDMKEKEKDFRCHNGRAALIRCDLLGLN